MIISGEYTGKRFEIASRIPYQWHLMQGADTTACPLYVLLEHNAEKIIPIFTQFSDEGIMPAGLLLFLVSGTLEATLPGGEPRGMRAEEFDQNGPDFTNLIIEEIVPFIAEQAKVTISNNPDMHFFTGGSSGGFATWNALWYRNDYFRRGFLSSPTFSAMRGGEEIMTLVRKSEGRPMRLYLTVGTNEPDYYFGDSYYVARNAESALTYANYDFKCQVFNGCGHCAKREAPETLRDVMNFLWKNWKNQPITKPKNHIRIQNIMPDNSAWEEISEMPQKKSMVFALDGAYIIKNGKLFFFQKEKFKWVAPELENISAIAISSDGWRLYIADTQRRFIFAYAIAPDGSLGGQYKLAPLHLPHDCHRIGASDIVVASDDRLFAATELGVQGIVSFGITDIILPLPGDLPCNKISLVGNTLYASSGNRHFKRQLLLSAQESGKITHPNTPGYGDSFDYSRPHDAR